MKLIINIDEDSYRECKFRKDLLSLGGEPTDLTFNMRMETTIANGTPLEEIPNPCIECSQNCCVCELNGEKCECQKVYVVKENK